MLKKGNLKRDVFPCGARVRLLLPCIQRSGRGQEILLNGKAACLCLCVHLSDKMELKEQKGQMRERERERGGTSTMPPAEKA